MSERSSRHELAAAAVLALVACKHPPEADPAKVQKLADTILKNEPVHAGVRACKPEELLGGATLTFRTVRQLAKREAADEATLADWINPTDLDAPAALELLDAKADEGARRRAAAELLAAPSFLVYRVDSVDAPMALGVKEIKRGTIGARAIRYARSGAPVCAHTFQFQNSSGKFEWAVATNKIIVMDPKVSKALREDLSARMLQRIAALAAPEAPPIIPTPPPSAQGDD